MQERLWIGAAVCLLIAVVSGIAEHRRRRRRDMDRVGVIPWTLVQVLALIGAVMFGYAAVH